MSTDTLTLKRKVYGVPRVVRWYNVYASCKRFAVLMAEANNPDFKAHGTREVEEGMWRVELWK